MLRFIEFLMLGFVLLFAVGAWAVLEAANTPQSAVFQDLSILLAGIGLALSLLGVGVCEGLIGIRRDARRAAEARASVRTETATAAPTP